MSGRIKTALGHAFSTLQAHSRLCPVSMQESGAISQPSAVKEGGENVEALASAADKAPERLDTLFSAWKEEGSSESRPALCMVRGGPGHGCITVFDQYFSGSRTANCCAQAQALFPQPQPTLSIQF